MILTFCAGLLLIFSSSMLEFEIFPAKLILLSDYISSTLWISNFLRRDIACDIIEKGIIGSKGEFIEKSSNKTRLNNKNCFHFFHIVFRKMIQNFLKLKNIWKRAIDKCHWKLIFQVRYFFIQCSYNMPKYVDFFFFWKFMSVQAINHITFNIIWWFGKNVQLLNSFILGINGKLIYFLKSFFVIFQCFSQLFR